MTLNEYQTLAARTIASDDNAQMVAHSLHGLSAEVGELHGIFQKLYQGHHLDEEHAKKEVGDILWMLAEFCTGMCWKLSDVAQLNIDKLKARYPDGFSVDRSLHRADGDV